MLREWNKIKQQSGVEGFRRWFSDDEMDLVLWYAPDGELRGFQIIYDRLDDPGSIMWTEKDGFCHFTVDEGEEVGLKETPLLYADGSFPRERVWQAFLERSRSVDPLIRHAVSARMHSFAHSPYAGYQARRGISPTR